MVVRNERAQTRRTTMFELSRRAQLAAAALSSLLLFAVFAGCEGDPDETDGNDPDETVAADGQALIVSEPKMESNVAHPGVHLYTTGMSAAQVTAAAQKIKQLALGSSNAETCYSGPAGKAQLAVQTELVVSEYATNPNATLTALDARLDALFNEGLAVHLLLPAHQVQSLGTWEGVNWSSAVSSWPNSSTFVPMKPCASEFVNGVKCPYDVLFDEFQKPVIQHLVQTGRAQKLAVLYVINEFGYKPDIKSDTAADWGGVANWKLKRAEALAYTAVRALNKARTQVAGTVPVGLKFASVTSSHTGWAYDPVYGTDQLSYVLKDVMAVNGDVLGYDVYFNPGDQYDTANKQRLNPFLPLFANGKMEVAEFGRVCSGPPGVFNSGSRTSASDITGAASYWSTAKALNLFAMNASGPDGGCYSLTDPNNVNTVYSGAAAEAQGLWSLIKNVTGSASPSVCAAPVAAGTCASPLTVAAGGGTYSGTTSGSSAQTGGCGGGSAPEKVYKWTPAKSGVATVSTCGSGYDTLVYMRADSCGAGTQLQCVDDSCGLGSQFSVNVVAGKTYYVFVDGWSGGGSYTLSVTAPP